MESNLFLCEHCLMGLESHEGRQFTKIHYLDEEDERKCDWCEEDFMDKLYEVLGEA